MIHTFDVDIAVEYGMLEAVLVQHFQFWITKNQANETNFYNGFYWTYNSIKALCNLFPYASEKQLRSALKNLIDKGILQTARFNTNTMDRTLWYAFTEKGKCICPRGQMEMPKKANVHLPKKELAFALEGKCINSKNNNNIYITDYYITDNYTDNYITDKDNLNINIYINTLEKIENEELKKALIRFIQMRHTNKSSLTSDALELCVQELFKLSNSIEEMIAIVNQSVANNWKSFYPLKSKKQHNRLAF